MAEPHSQDLHRALATGDPRLAIRVECSRCGCSWSQLGRYPKLFCGCTPKDKKGRPRAGKVLAMVTPFVTTENENA